MVVQPDVCNGCGYCVPACPFGVIDRARGRRARRKCTLCYDRLKDGLEPACAKACPTDSIQFGALDELRERARRTASSALHERGVAERAPLRRATPTTASAASARSSCCSTSPRSTGCRPTPSPPPATSPGVDRGGRGGAALAAGSRRGARRRPAVSTGAWEGAPGCRGTEAGLLPRPPRPQGAGVDVGGPGRTSSPAASRARRPALAFAAGHAGHGELARRTWPVALGAVGAARALLISDLGRPERFLNMLRVVKLDVADERRARGSSPPAARRPRRRRRTPAPAPSRAVGARRGRRAALLGLPLTTYTAVLVAEHRGPRLARGAADAAVRVRRRRARPPPAPPRRSLTPGRRRGPPRGPRRPPPRRSSGDRRRWSGGLGRRWASPTPGRAGRDARAARTLTVAGAALVGTLGGRRRAAAVAGGAAAARRLACHALVGDGRRAPVGRRSGRYTVGPQRARLTTDD